MTSSQFFTNTFVREEVGKGGSIIGEKNKLALNDVLGNLTHFEHTFF